MKVTMQNAQHNAGGIAGTGLAWVGVITSELSMVEQWLRIVSLVGAITVSVVTLYYLIKRNNVRPPL